MIVLKNCRLNWVKLVDGETDEKGNVTYTAQVIIPKTEKAQIELIKGEFINAKKAAVEKYGEKAKNIKFDLLKDGDSEEMMASKYNEPNIGAYTFKVKNKNQPMMVGKNGKEMQDLTQFYSGVYVNIKINAGTWEFKGKPGISFYVQVVQFHKDGENLGGSKVNLDGFDIEDDAYLFFGIEKVIPTENNKITIK